MRPTAPCGTAIGTQSGYKILPRRWRGSARLSLVPINQLGRFARFRLLVVNFEAASAREASTAEVLFHLNRDVVIC